MVRKIRRKRKPINKKRIALSFIVTLVISTIIYIVYKTIIPFIISLIAIPILILVYFYVKDMLKKTERIKKIEEIFPDFLQLMSSNLRAGMTIDKAMLLSSRPEFAPLDAEIIQTGKDIATGKDIGESLLSMSRINSKSISKTILLLISGIKAGGDIAILLEETAVNMRERKFVEKKAASNVLMYVIFIFLAVSIFAPALFSLSVVLVEVLTNILSGLPDVDPGTAKLPFSLSKVNISVDFIKYFSLTFMIIIDIFATLVLGLVSKGEEKQGLKYLPIIVTLSVAIFFITQILIGRFLSGFF